MTNINETVYDALLTSAGELKARALAKEFAMMDEFIKLEQVRREESEKRAMQRFLVVTGLLVATFAAVIAVLVNQ